MALAEWRFPILVEVVLFCFLVAERWCMRFDIRRRNTPHLHSLSLLLPASPCCTSERTFAVAAMIPVDDINCSPGRPWTRVELECDTQVTAMDAKVPTGEGREVGSRNFAFPIDFASQAVLVTVPFFFLMVSFFRNSSC